MVADTVSAEERLLNLVLALQDTRFGMTKREILETVAGYAEDVRRGTATPAALERRFERDKATLRDRGIELIASDDPAAPGDNQRTRYHIDTRGYALPEDLVLDDEDLGLIAAAAVLLSSFDVAGGRHIDTRARALTGRETDRPAEPTVDGLLDLVVHEPDLQPLQRAALDHTIMRFDYHTADHDTATTRTVLPVAVVLRDGRWHAHAIDLDRLAADARPATRTFLLQRITRRAAPAADVDPALAARARAAAAVHDPDDWAARALAELDRVRAAQWVVVAVCPGSEAAVRLGDRLEPAPADPSAGADPAVPWYTLHTTDLDLLADELAGYGDEVQALAPLGFRERVHHKLQRLIDDHADRPGAHPEEVDHV